MMRVVKCGCLGKCCCEFLCHLVVKRKIKSNVPYCVNEREKCFVCVPLASSNKLILLFFCIQGSKPERTQSDQLVYKQNGKTVTSRLTGLTAITVE